jgi:hypothetical protein
MMFDKRSIMQQLAAEDDTPQRTNKITEVVRMLPIIREACRQLMMMMIEREMSGGTSARYEILVRGHDVTSAIYVTICRRTVNDDITALDVITSGSGNGNGLHANGSNG